MFKSILTLKTRLPSDQRVEVVHSGHVWTASFRWSIPADHKIMHEISTEFWHLLPKDYIVFIEQISNGAILYYDAKFGQWGFEIYGIEKLIEKQALWQKSIPINWESHLIAFGELFGEANAMVFDLTKPSVQRDSYAVLEANALDPIENWRIASRSFHEWLDHLLTAQGDKYWLWM